MLDSFTFTHNGAEYVAELHLDDTCETPWDREDGHGPVTGWQRRAKLPGEMVLCEDRGARRFYDFAEACRIAQRDGWDAPPYRTGTKRQRAARAALADFNRLRDWCNDEWHYLGVIVRHADACQCCGESESLWGIESDAHDYLREVARELAEGLSMEAAA
jgi:hypothetical protein